MRILSSLGLTGQVVGLAGSILTVMSSLVLRLYCALRSSKKLHDESFLALMRSPLSYFEATPQGRILNLFTRDIFVVDEVLPNSFGAFFRTVCPDIPDSNADRVDHVGTRSCCCHCCRCSLRFACLYPSGLPIPHCHEVGGTSCVTIAHGLATTSPRLAS